MNCALPSEGWVLREKTLRDCETIITIGFTEDLGDLVSHVIET